MAPQLKLSIDLTFLRRFIICDALIILILSLVLISTILSFNFSSIDNRSLVK